MIKNTGGQKIGAQMITAADGTIFTGTVTVYVTGDAGSQALGSVGSGVCTNEGNGYSTYAPAQAETNYALIAFTFIGTGAISTTVQVFTQIVQQTANNNTILAHADYGNAKLVRSTTPANALDVNATGEAGLNLDNTSGTLDAAQFGADFLTAAKIADDALVAANFATGAFTADAFAADALIAATFATDSISADALAADAVTEIQNGLAPASEYDTEMARITANVATETKQDLQATLAEQAKIPKFDGTVTWNNTALASIKTQVTDGINTALPGTPTAASLGDYMKRAKFAVCNKFEVDEDDGDARTYDDSGTIFTTTLSAFTSASTITKREKIL